jgi:hypothetical protein
LVEVNVSEKRVVFIVKSELMSRDRESEAWAIAAVAAVS